MAQSQNISGTVVDATGGLVPDATVKIVDAAKGGTAREDQYGSGGPFPGHQYSAGQVCHHCREDRLQDG